ncbi:MAG TPA: alpha/beta hydrolase-fold protein [Pyrinomonadaceae bacterium]|jgi:predicted alpha/beta superfamily hydrolase|nr:alpha/beta hydrolase-fold protein [Pyrinomonadaceae bacterium]
MKKSAVIFLLSLFLLTAHCFNLQAQNETALHVTFILTSPDLPADTSVYITGSVEQLGSWNPDRVKMEPKGDHTWTKEISIQRALSIEYKYTLGSWEREGADANGSPLSNFGVDVTADKTVKDTVLFWTKGARQRVNHGQITGTVRYHRGLKGAGIQDRDLIVWLPPGYEADKTRRYAVIYMHDGQNIFDPVTSAFGVDWSIDETVDNLIKTKSIDPVIVVGIYNTSDRMKEYTPGDKGTAYMDFVVKTVKPFIDTTYRTLPDRKHTIVGGSSAGGIISFMLVWEHPDVFSKAICMSPAFMSLSSDGWDYTRVVQSSNGPKKNIFLYIDNGGIGLDSQLQPGIDSMLGVLKAKGYKQAKDFVFVRDPTAKHFEADWAKRFPSALMLVLGNNHHFKP